MAKKKSENAAAITLNVKDKEDADRQLAKVYTSPVTLSANTMRNLHKDHDFSLPELMHALNDYSSNTKENALEPLQGMLIQQMQVLHSIFTKATNQWAGANYLPQYQAYGAIAMKAQNLCRMTAATLSDMRNPNRTTFIKNTAQNQQINLGNPASKKDSAKSSNELLSEGKDATLDSGGTSAASGTDKELEAVEKSRR